MTTMYEELEEQRREIVALRIRIDLLERAITGVKEPDISIFQQRFADGGANERGNTEGVGQ